jgi:hypothetical protein
VKAVQTAELSDGAVDEILHRLRIGEIEFDGDGTAAGLRDPLGGGGDTGDVDVSDGYASTLGGKTFGGGCADSGGSTGDQECLAVQSAHQT